MMGQCPSVLEAASVTAQPSAESYQYAKRWFDNNAHFLPIFYPIMTEEIYLGDFIPADFVMGETVQITSNASAVKRKAIESPSSEKLIEKPISKKPKKQDKKPNA